MLLTISRHKFTVYYYLSTRTWTCARFVRRCFLGRFHFTSKHRISKSRSNEIIRQRYVSWIQKFQYLFYLVASDTYLSLVRGTSRQTHLSTFQGFKDQKKAKSRSRTVTSYVAVVDPQTLLRSTQRSYVRRVYFAKALYLLIVRSFVREFIW